MTMMVSFNNPGAAPLTSARCRASGPSTDWASGTVRADDPTGQEARAMVHIVHCDAAMAADLAALCRSAGMAACIYPDAAAFVRTPSPEIPSCMIVHADPASVDDLELLTQFRWPEARPPMIVTTNQADGRTAMLALRAGALDLFEKPLCEDHLLKAVATAIGLDRALRSIAVDRVALEARFDTLTGRERQVMALVTQGRLNKQVGGDLGISEITVKAHRGSVMRKMGARTLADLVRMADAIARFADLA